jgi:hypothetical protein
VQLFHIPSFEKGVLELVIPIEIFDFMEVIHVELSDKRRVILSFKILWEDFYEGLVVFYYERVPVGIPFY